MAFNLEQDFLGNISRVSGVNICRLKSRNIIPSPWVLTLLPSPWLKIAFWTFRSGLKIFMLIKGGEVGLIRETQDVYFLMFCNRMATFFYKCCSYVRAWGRSTFGLVLSVIPDFTFLTEFGLGLGCMSRWGHGYRELTALHLLGWELGLLLTLSYYVFPCHLSFRSYTYAIS